MSLTLLATAGDQEAWQSRQRIILLDLNMPTMNGIVFLRESRADAKLKPSPVTVLTTSNDEPS